MGGIDDTGNDDTHTSFADGGLEQVNRTRALRETEPPTTLMHMLVFVRDRIVPSPSTVHLKLSAGPQVHRPIWSLSSRSPPYAARHRLASLLVRIVESLGS